VVSPQAETDLLRTSAYYDRTASTYDDQVDGLALNRAMREAFCARVSALAGPSGRVLDFGCGTGTDAAWYAARGHSVIAYDISAGMVDMLRVRCADAIAQGRIAPVVGTLGELEQELQHRPPLDAIAANFAVLNHVQNLQLLLARLASHLRPGGVVVASLLNPLYKGPMRWRGWCRLQVMSQWSGAITLRGDVTTYRPYMRTLRRMAKPHFALVEVGHIDERGEWSKRPARWRDTVQEQFRFVVLQRHV
jgi:SAM-dependent methyltransferase